MCVEYIYLRSYTVYYKLKSITSFIKFINNSKMFLINKENHKEKLQNFVNQKHFRIIYKFDKRSYRFKFIIYSIRTQINIFYTHYRIRKVMTALIMSFFLIKFMVNFINMKVGNHNLNLVNLIKMQ